MRRRLFNAAAVLSLLLGVAVVVLWAASYGRTTVIWHVHSRGTTTLLLEQGGISVVRELSPSPGQDEWNMIWMVRVSEAERGWIPRGGVLGFGRQRIDTPHSGSFAPWRAWTVPLWPVAIFFAGLFLWSLRERRRFSAGLCASCGYDLRATPERCPECGRAAASSVETSETTI